MVSSLLLLIYYTNCVHRLVVKYQVIFISLWVILCKNGIIIVLVGFVSVTMLI